MTWICTKCSLHFENKSRYNWHLSSVEHAEIGQAKEQPTCKISQLPTVTRPPVPNTTQNLHLKPTFGQIGQVKDIQTAVQTSISEEGHKPFATTQPIVPIPYTNHPNNQVESGNGPNGLQECEICHTKLAQSTSLSRHRKIHSGDKPHKCPYCNKQFIQAYNMKIHIKTHRKESAHGNLLEGIDKKII